MSASMNYSTLGNISNVKPVGSWVDAVDQENNLLNSTQKRTESIKNGLKTVVDEINDKENGKYRVITTYKVITKKVPRAVAERKNWKKFGAALNDGTGPNIKTTYVTEEVHIKFLPNKIGENQDQENIDDRKSDGVKGYAGKAHCRICKADDHWSVNCPYKEMYQINDNENDNGDKLTSKQSTASGRYVNPYARGDRAVTERRSDDFTCRVTNLPEDSETLDEDLRAMFGSVGRIERFYLARDKMTNKPKGFAFITYSNRSDAEVAIERFSGYKMEHLILKVEWTKPSGN